MSRPFFGQFALFSMPLQKTIAAAVLISVAATAGPTIAAGFPLPYWLRYAMILTGISCREDMLMIKNVHISFDAMPFPAGFLPCPSCRFVSSCTSASIAFNPAGVAAHPRPKMFAIKFVAIY